MTGAIFFCPLLRAPEVPPAFLCRAERGNDRQRDIRFALPHQFHRIASIRSKRSSMISAPCACAAAACAGSVREATICMYLTVCRGATKRYARRGFFYRCFKGYRFIPFRVETLRWIWNLRQSWQRSGLPVGALGWCVIACTRPAARRGVRCSVSPLPLPGALVASAFVIEYGSIPIGIGLGLPVNYVVPAATSIEAGIFLGLFGLLDTIGTASGRVARFLAWTHGMVTRSRIFDRYGIYGLFPAEIIIGVYLCAPASWLFGLAASGGPLRSRWPGYASPRWPPPLPPSGSFTISSPCSEAAMDNSTRFPGKKKIPELLAPAGSMEAFFAAVAAGADAVYLSGKRFGARKFAQNFSEEEIEEAITYAHARGVRVYVTVNTLVHDRELPGVA